jgi:CheY-like chemotaxis protein
MLQDIPVVVYTTSRLTEDKEKMMALGAEYFIVKPTSANELFSAIEKVFIMEMI